MKVVGPLMLTRLVCVFGFVCVFSHVSKMDDECENQGQLDDFFRVVVKEHTESL